MLQLFWYPDRNQIGKILSLDHAAHEGIWVQISLEWIIWVLVIPKTWIHTSEDPELRYAWGNHIWKSGNRVLRVVHNENNPGGLSRLTLIKLEGNYESKVDDQEADAAYLKLTDSQIVESEEVSWYYLRFWWKKIR